MLGLVEQKCICTFWQDSLCENKYSCSCPGSLLCTEEKNAYKTNICIILICIMIYKTLALKETGNYCCYFKTFIHYIGNKLMWINIYEKSTKMLSAGTLSTTALPPKNPRPRGLYGTIPIPSSLPTSMYKKSSLVYISIYLHRKSNLF